MSGFVLFYEVCVDCLISQQKMPFYKALGSCIFGITFPVRECFFQIDDRSYMNLKFMTILGK